MAKNIETFRDLKEWLDEQPEHYLDEEIEVHAKFDTEGNLLEEDTLIEINSGDIAFTGMVLIGRENLNKDEE